MSEKSVSTLNDEPLSWWNPYLDLQEMQKRIDKQFVQLFGNLDNLSVNLYEKEGKLVVEASVPGMSSKDLSVSLDGRTLTITGETEMQKEDKERKYFIREKSYRSIYRSIDLPVSVDTDKVEAECVNGVLRVEIPRIESSQAKNIRIK